jgi:fumarate hydratase class II
MPIDLVHAIVTIKMAAAQANLFFKKMDHKKAQMVINTGKVILTHQLDNQFPLKI